MSEVDSSCYDTAVRFLKKVKGATAEDMQELAEAIQKLCEEFCGGLAADEAGEKDI
jgi:hypothetical protein